MRVPRIVLVCALGLAIAAAGGFIVERGVRSLDEPLNVTAPLRFRVPPGSRFARVAAELVGAGDCRSSRERG